MLTISNLSLILICVYFYMQRHQKINQRSKYKHGSEILSIYRTCANKGSGLYSKNILSVQHNGTFLPNFVYFYNIWLHKIQHNIPIFGKFRCGYYSRASFIGAGTVSMTLKYDIFQCCKPQNQPFFDILNHGLQFLCNYKFY